MARHDARIVRNAERGSERSTSAAWRAAHESRLNRQRASAHVECAKEAKKSGVGGAAAAFGNGATHTPARNRERGSVDALAPRDEERTPGTGSPERPGSRMEVEQSEARRVRTRTAPSTGEEVSMELDQPQRGEAGHGCGCSQEQGRREHEMIRSRVSSTARWMSSNPLCERKQELRFQFPLDHHWPRSYLETVAQGT